MISSPRLGSVWPLRIFHMDAGKRAAIWVKISTDMPLPTPRSVINSPNHMMIDVPAVIVITITTIGKMSVL